MDDEICMSDNNVNEDEDTELDDETAIFKEKTHHWHEDSNLSSNRVSVSNKKTASNHHHIVKSTKP